MTNNPAKSRRPLRNARLETKVDARIYDAVDDFAIANGFTQSTAIYNILLHWDKKERRKVNRQQKDC